MQLSPPPHTHTPQRWNEFVGRKHIKWTPGWNVAVSEHDDDDDDDDDEDDDDFDDKNKMQRTTSNDDEDDADHNDVNNLIWRGRFVC